MALAPPAKTSISIYSFSVMLYLRSTAIAFCSIIFLPSSTDSVVASLSTSSSYSDLPTMAPRAMAIGRPVIPVPGIPTPIAFLSTLALKRASMRSGRQPRVSVALATQRATAIGSVQPIAGTISRFIRAIISLRSSAVKVLFIATKL